MAHIKTHEELVMESKLEKAFVAFFSAGLQNLQPAFSDAQRKTLAEESFKTLMVYDKVEQGEISQEAFIEALEANEALFLHALQEAGVHYDDAATEKFADHLEDLFNESRQELALAAHTALDGMLEGFMNRPH